MINMKLAWYNTLWGYFVMPNLALIREGDTGANKLQHLVKIAVFRRFFAPKPSNSMYR